MVGMVEVCGQRCYRFGYLLSAQGVVETILLSLLYFEKLIETDKVIL